ncbi:hypothetical protein PVNG_05841 [Plasmodium vivax North Korean]|uniref:Variable surface protein Vir35 n=1 Tax=Plasmodium vivax North Korean TaxID=1035514 RepID=A0A0J9W747_PLAVI|nr:hypothetical protein PVNG_05841 [Plasmodium vivax North Korean]
MKSVFLFKISIFIFSIWMCYLNRNTCNSDKCLGKGCNIERSLGIRFHRSLTKSIHRKELYNTELGRKTPYHGENKKINNLSDDISAYTKLKKRGLNNYDLYRKVYKHRYAKKNALAKLDCLCEKKLFDKFDYICDLSEKLKNERKSFKRVLFQKYGIGLILLSLIPLLGIIVPLYLYEKYTKKKLFPFFNGAVEGYKIGGCRPFWKDFAGFTITNEIHINTWKLISKLNIAFIVASTIIILIIIFFILIKINKYKRLKAGKGKMNLKE